MTRRTRGECKDEKLLQAEEEVGGEETGRRDARADEEDEGKMSKDEFFGPARVSNTNRSGQGAHCQEEQQFSVLVPVACSLPPLLHVGGHRPIFHAL